MAQRIPASTSTAPRRVCIAAYPARQDVVGGVVVFIIFRAAAAANKNKRLTTVPVTQISEN